MINLAEVGAFPVAAAGGFQVRFGLYLPGIRGQDGFEVVVKLIHRDDRFTPQIQTQNTGLTWQQGHPLDLWTATAAINPVAGTNFGREGTYLYRYQLLWHGQVITLWFCDPFARMTDIGRLSAVTVSRAVDPFQWTDAAYQTPELDDLVVYELQVEEFNDTFDGVIERLPYLQSLGVNCLELMPAMSAKLDFDWGYGPLHYFSPSARFGGPDGLKRLVNACHAVGIAVILDVVYQHVDPIFPYHLVYDDLSRVSRAPAVPSPMINGSGDFGPTNDFSLPFTQDYFLAANRFWLDEYHVDGFRYDEVTDLYKGPTDTGYAKLAYETYRGSLNTPRFQRQPQSYSRIIQCAEALSRARDVLTNTFTSCAWQDDLLNQARDIVGGASVKDSFAHQLDPGFVGYPQTKTVVNAAGNPVDMPVAPFQYLSSHDHSHLIISAGLTGDGLLPFGDRSKFYLLQPLAIALYTLEGIPMLWQGEEFAENWELPDKGSARINLRRDTHWEYFYDEYGFALVRLYRRLGQLRRNQRALRSRESFYYFQQSLQGNQVLAYHRRAAPTAAGAEDFAMVALNFGDAAADIQLPFPRRGVWREMLDDDVRSTPFAINISAQGAAQRITVPSHYGWVLILQP
ncbi:MAG TPA: alpha-amylase family glycosyl hydrolase [Candidatus Angelobacter sp.]|nr:alpha-amylase family glycosyl hydrolase [Candidatus Angelobacter sp.]